MHSLHILIYVFLFSWWFSKFYNHTERNALNLIWNNNQIIFIKAKKKKIQYLPQAVIWRGDRKNKQHLSNLNNPFAKFLM